MEITYQRKGDYFYPNLFQPEGKPWVTGKYRKIHAWKFNGKEIDPAKLPSRDDVLSRILASGGADADHGILMDWDYGVNGSGLTYHARFTGSNGGCYLLPVREGVLRIPYGTQTALEPSNREVFNSVLTIRPA